MTVPFPGGTSVSRLRVYDWPTPDGAGLVGGGTPHLHTASAEGYVVLGGTGAVQTLGPDGFVEHRLEAGTLLWFEPGVVHRLLNDGGLEILVVMSNAGLPEAGDAVMTFPLDVLRDPERYAGAAALPPVEVPSDADADGPVARAARSRRDLALEGFAALRSRVDDVGPADAMGELHEAAAHLVRDRVPTWRATWEATVADQTRATDRALASLAHGLAPHLATARTASSDVRPAPARFGMCGRLDTWAL